MEGQNPSGGEKTLSEHDWVEALDRLSAKVQGKDFYVVYSFPAGNLFATGFQLRVDGQMIRILLQRESRGGSADAVLELFLPAEETAHYRQVVSEEGEMLLWVTYPYCTHNLHRGAEKAKIQISTSVELLELVESDAPMQ
jgi:hypothetical protein